MIYYILATISLLCPMIIKNKKTYFFMIFGMMILISGLRGIDVGTDTAGYHDLFYMRKDISLYELFSSTNEATEPGVWLLMQISYILSDNAQMFIFICSLVTYVFLGVFLYKNTDMKYYGIAVFLVFSIGFFMYQMNAMRQALGIAIACNSFNYLMESKYVKASLIVLCASLMHFSMLVMLPIVLLLSYLNKNENRSGLNRIKMLFLSCGILIAIFGIVFNYLVNNLDLLNFSLSYQSYFDVRNKRSSEGEAGLYLIGLSLIYCLLILYTNLMEMDTIKKGKVFLESQLLSFAVVFTVSIMLVMQIFFRFVDTFSIYFCLLVPDFLRNVKPVYLRPLVIVLIVLFGYISIWYILFKGFNGVSEYEFL